MGKPSANGSTFAERKAAAEGKGSFDDPTPDNPDAVENTTFGSRGGKQVKAAEDKAVKPAATKTKARKG